VIVDAHTRVQGSYIGPYTSLRANCLVRDNEVKYSIFSIICPETQILDAPVRIERSLLGREVVTRRGHTRPGTQKSIIGDQCMIEIV
jgi:glucose-1-phosphate thymidylyltransferase